MAEQTSDESRDGQKLPDLDDRHVATPTTPRDRLSRALQLLKEQLVAMQRQDVLILRQLMRVHAGLGLLNGSRDPHRRAASSSSLLQPHDGPAPPDSPTPFDQLAPPPDHAHPRPPPISMAGHKPLRREASEPVENSSFCLQWPRLQRSNTTEEEPGLQREGLEQDPDPLSHSFTVFSSAGESAAWLRNLQPPAVLASPAFSPGKRYSTIREEQQRDHVTQLDQSTRQPNFPNVATAADAQRTLSTRSQSAQNIAKHESGFQSTYNIGNQSKPEGGFQSSPRPTLGSSNHSDTSGDTWYVDSDADDIFEEGEEESHVTRRVSDNRGSADFSEYELHYESLLRKSAKLWKEVQRESEETGCVDKRKIATLKLFL